MRFKPLELPRKWGHVRLTIHAWLVVTLVFGSAVNPALAATYFVNAATGDDSRTAAQAQSAATPWRTITRSITEPTLVSSDTINVAAGTYDASEPNEIFPLFLVNGVAIVGADRDTTFIRPPDGTQAFRNPDPNFPATTANLSSATRLSGFTLQDDPNDTNLGQPLVEFQVGVMTMSPQIDDNHFVSDPNENDIGILYRDASSGDGTFAATIDGNTFTGFEDAGIFDSQTSGGTGDDFSPTISNNSFTANSVGILFSLTGTSDRAAPVASGVRGGNDSAEGNVAPLIEDNTFGDASGGGNGNDIYARILPFGEDLTFAPTIQNNTFTGTSSTSISISMTSGFMNSSSDTFELSPTIEGNDFGDPNDPNDPNDLGPGGAAVAVDVDDLDNGNFVSNMTIQNNTITGAGGDGISISVTSLSSADGCSVDWTISNNSVTNAGGDGIQVYASDFCSTGKVAGGSQPVAGRGGSNNFSLTVASNTITGTGDNGITVSVSSLSSIPVTVLIDNNTITDVGLGCSSTTTTTTTTTSPRAAGKGKDRVRGGGCSYQDGIFLTIFDMDSASVSATVTNNTVTRTADDGIEVNVETISSESVTVNVDDNIVADAGIFGCDVQPPNAQAPLASSRLGGEGVRGRIDRPDGIVFGVNLGSKQPPGSRGNRGFPEYTATVSGNTITGPADDGISVSIGDFSSVTMEVSVLNNTITDAGSCAFTSNPDRSRGRGFSATGRGIVMEVGSSSISTANASFILSGNTVTGASGTGIEVSVSNSFGQNLDQTLLVQSNTVTGSGDDGLSVFAGWQSGNTANDIQITENLIRSNGEDGLIVGGFGYQNGNPTLVSCNTITGNGGNGVVQSFFSAPARGDSGAPADFGGGNLSSPGRNIITGNATSGPDPNDPNAVGPFQFLSIHPDPIQAEQNFWGSTDAPTIDAGIFDDDENASVGAVDFDPFLLVPGGFQTVPLTYAIVNDVPIGGPSYGDTIRYTATIDVPAVDCACLDVVFSAPIPSNGSLVASTLTSTRGTTTEQPGQVSVDLDALVPGEQIVITWDVLVGNTGTDVTTQGTLGCAGVFDQLSDDPNTPAAPDDPTIILLGFPTPTPTATATATPTATATATATPTATPGPRCSRNDTCFLWELLDVDFTVATDATFTWRLTNTCTSDVTRADFRFIPGASVTDPTEPGTFTSTSGRTYAVDIVGGEHAGIGFTPTGTPLGPNESDEFTFTVLRSTLQSGTVLWNNATAGASTGRMDMRSGLCYQLPQSLSVVEPEACLGASAQAAQDWTVKVRWSVPAQSGVRNFQLYRIEGAGQVRSVHDGTLEPDASGVVRFTDRCPVGSATGYRIQPVTRGGEPAEPATEVSVSGCAPVLGPSSEMPQFLLFLALLACAALGLPGFRRRFRVR